jgi:AcrR family transcriptional regulator
MQIDQTDKRQMVLQTTLHMIHETGIQATSMAKVSKRSGVAVGTIYHYFESKEALITELYRSIKMELLGRIFDDFEASEDIRQGFEHVIRQMIAFAKSQPEAYAFVEGYAASPEINSDVKAEVYEAYLKHVGVMYDALKRQSPNLISMHLLNVYLDGALSFLIRACIAGEIEWDDPEIDTYIEMVWHGITGRSTSV